METKRVDIGELEGAALAYAVGKAEGRKLWIAEGNKPEHMLRDKVSRECFYPVGNWSQCGPLIERYITALNQSGYGWWAHSGNHLGEALSPLIAACRAIVASHNPDGYVEVPVELLP